MNKNKIKILRIILLIIASICVCYFLKGKGFVMGTTSGKNQSFMLNITDKQMRDSYENVYSVDYLQQLFSEEIDYNFESISLAKIRGDKVTFSDGTTTIEGNTCTENNIMAAIVSGAGVDGTGYEHDVFYSGAQLAVWEFWNTWVENSGAKANGFEKGNGNEEVTVTEIGLNGQEQRKIAQQYATQEKYNVNIYFLKYFADNNTHITEKLGGEIDNQPNLIYVEVLDEDGDVIELEAEPEMGSQMSLSITDNKESAVQAGEEIIYNIGVYNLGNEEQKDLKLISKLPKGVTFINVVEMVNSTEEQLNKNTDYTYNEKTRELSVNINQINASTEGTYIDETTRETSQFFKNGYRNYKVTVKVNELEDGVYIKNIQNVVEVRKDNTVLATGNSINIISKAYLEIETEKLPEKTNENEQCVIGLKITNKGLITAENVNIKISVPEEILMSSYKIDILSENGELERTSQGTMSNEFENNSIEIYGQKTVYIQLIGTVDEIEEAKQIEIEGTVNDKKVTWNTNIQEKGGH